MDTIALIREHVADEHDVTRVGCPVCADLPRQRRMPEWRRRSLAAANGSRFVAVTDTTDAVLR